MLTKRDSYLNQLPLIGLKGLVTPLVLELLNEESNPTTDHKEKNNEIIDQNPRPLKKKKKDKFGSPPPIFSKLQVEDYPLYTFFLRARADLLPLRNRLYNLKIQDTKTLSAYFAMRRKRPRNTCSSTVLHCKT